jgi:uncharacterized membrane protein YjjP (DUF1212 family)
MGNKELHLWTISALVMLLAGAFMWVQSGGWRPFAVGVAATAGQVYREIAAARKRHADAVAA